MQQPTGKHRQWSAISMSSITVTYVERHLSQFIYTALSDLLKTFMNCIFANEEIVVNVVAANAKKASDSNSMLCKK